MRVTHEWQNQLYENSRIERR